MLDEKELKKHVDDIAVDMQSLANKLQIHSEIALFLLDLSVNTEIDAEIRNKAHELYLMV